MSVMTSCTVTFEQKIKVHYVVRTQKACFSFRIENLASLSLFNDCYVYILMFLLCQIGIIGGTGIGDPDVLEKQIEKEVDTPFGKVTLCSMGTAFCTF